MNFGDASRLVNVADLVDNQIFGAETLLKLANMAKLELALIVGESITDMVVYVEAKRGDTPIYASFDNCNFQFQTESTYVGFGYRIGYNGGFWYFESPITSEMFEDGEGVLLNQSTIYEVKHVYTYHQRPPKWPNLTILPALCATLGTYFNMQTIAL